MGKHAIIVIKNKKKEYLQYFDDRWNSYLFPNCKMLDKDNKFPIIKMMQESFSVQENNIKCTFKFEKKHEKFSESAKIKKEYTHYFYQVDLKKMPNIMNDKEFIISQVKYRWFSFEELLNNERIQKVNSDIVGYIKENNL